MSRSLARQREFHAFVAKLQILEQHQAERDLIPISFVAGDFNDGNQNIEFVPSAYFADSWLLCEAAARQGEYTFDWKLNQRAERTRTFVHLANPPRRIDRVYIVKDSETDTVPLIPLATSLLGTSTNHLPPSDHFGVCVDLGVVKAGDGRRSRTSKSGSIAHNAWACTALPTTNSMLVLQLDQKKCANFEMFDETSSLPIPHITFLNGFVELSNDEHIQLAQQAVQVSIESMNARMSGRDKEFQLPLCAEAFTVFEHNNSATLVYTPKPSDTRTRWLFDLYASFRVMFPQCHEQESRFAEGWTPHISLGYFPTSNAARARLQEMQTTFDKFGEFEVLGAQSVGIYRRSVIDRKFYCLSSFPLVRQSVAKIAKRDDREFIDQAGLQWHNFTKGVGCGILHEIERAVGNTAHNLFGASITTELKPFGSYASYSSLPGISDHDFVAVLKPLLQQSETPLRTMSRNMFLEKIALQLHSLHPHMKHRFRLSSAGGLALSILTLKLVPGSPTVDIMLCCENTNGDALDDASLAAKMTLSDCAVLIEEIKKTGAETSRFDLDAIFFGALRILKLWANRRKIYGTHLGYLGGYGWSLWLASIVCRDVKSKSLVFPTSMSVEQGAAVLVSHFFKATRGQAYPLIVSLPENMFTSSSSANFQLAVTRAQQRNTMAVVAPTSGGNCGCSSTPTTTLTTLREINQAADILKECSDVAVVLAQMLCPYKLGSNMGMNSQVFMMHISCDTETEYPLIPAQVKHWGALQFLQIVLSLEKWLGDASKIRPISKMFQLKEGGFMFAIQVHDVSLQNDELNSFLAEQTDFLTSNQRITLPDATVAIACNTGEEVWQLSDRVRR